jgi:hypothetical protein
MGIRRGPRRSCSKSPVRESIAAPGPDRGRMGLRPACHSSALTRSCRSWNIVQAIHEVCSLSHARHFWAWRRRGRKGQACASKVGANREATPTSPTSSGRCVCGPVTGDRSGIDALRVSVAPQTTDGVRSPQRLLLGAKTNGNRTAALEKEGADQSPLRLPPANR